MTLTVSQRNQHLGWVLELTSIPTAAGREHRVVAWIQDWLNRRKNLSLYSDQHGNLMIRLKSTGKRSGPTIIFTAHLDHPAFVVTAVGDKKKHGDVEMEFRGGVRPPYFDDARIVIHDREGGKHEATISSHRMGSEYRVATARLKKPSHATSIAVGDLATWKLPEAKVRGERIHAPACDDLAAAAAALSALDVLRKRKNIGDVRVLLTRAEEVGFVGAILAAQAKGFIPKDAYLIALENSRSFAESPIGGGPIVRVGDRISIFDHSLTFAITKVAEALQQNSTKTAPRKTNSKCDTKPFQYQRKLMAGGACEATAFQSFGYHATCVCLPLGNYHNMGNAEAVEKGDADHRARIAPEVIAVSDYHHLIELLVECGAEFTSRAKGPSDDPHPLDGAGAIKARMKDIRARRLGVLTESAADLGSLGK